MLFSFTTMLRTLPGPLAILLLAWWSIHVLPSLPDNFQSLLVMAPFAGAALVLAVALLFNQSRFLFLAMLLSISYLVLLRARAESESFQAEIFFIVYTCLLPLNLTVFSTIKERGIFNGRNVVLTGILLAQGALLLAILQNQPEALQQFMADWLPAAAGTRFPLAGTVLFIVAAAWLGVRLWRHPTPLNAGLLLLLPTVAAAALWQQIPAAPEVFLTAAGTILLLAMLLESHRIAHRDDLTGLLARRALDLHLAALGRRYVVAMLDVDHFKKFNDRYGHDVGDQVLRVVARQLQRVGGGTAYRYGGEEFAILFPGRTLDFALPRLESIRREIADYRLVLRGKDRPGRKPAAVRKPVKAPQSVKVTISIGVAERSAHIRTAGDVIKAADKALYRAKKSGRNCISV